MVDESLVEKLGLLGISQNQIDEDDGDVESVGYQAFAVTRQAFRSAIMLDLVFRTGESVSFSYSHLYKMELRQDRSVTLTFTEHEVVISGVSLAEMYRRLRMQRVLQITEADRPTRERAGHGDCIVTDIEVSTTGESSSTRLSSDGS